MKATEVTTGLAESNGSLLPGLWRDSLHVTCGLTACTPGSAPGLTLGNEYAKTLPLPDRIRLLLLLSDVMVCAEICPFGWEYYPGTDSCFYSSTFVADQNTAMSECRGMGADLPSIDNREEMRFLLGIS